MVIPPVPVISPVVVARAIVGIAVIAVASAIIVAIIAGTPTVVSGWKMLYATVIQDDSTSISITGHSKKVSAELFICFCLSLLLFYSEMAHKQ